MADDSHIGQLRDVAKGRKLRGQVLVQIQWDSFKREIGLWKCFTRKGAEESQHQPKMWNPASRETQKNSIWP